MKAGKNQRWNNGATVWILGAIDRHNRLFLVHNHEWINLWDVFYLSVG